MRRHALVGILIILFALTACSQKELSRSRAGSLIKEKIKEHQMTVNIFDGEFKSYAYHDLNPEYKLTKYLAKGGYINFEVTGYAQFKVTLEPAIKPFIIKEEPSKDGGDFKPMIATINLGESSLKEITGIRNIDGMERDLSGCNAIVDFTYEFKLTPIGELIPKEILTDLGINLNPNRTACFAKYDNGWRLMNIE